MIIKIMSLNLKGSDQRDTRIDNIVNYIQDKKPDIVAFQESVIHPDISEYPTSQIIQDRLGFVYGQFCPCFDYSKDYGKGILQETSVIEGLGVISRLPFHAHQQSLPIIKGVDRRPRIAMVCNFEQFSLNNIHLGNKSIENRNAQWEVLEKTDIIVGDFNTFPDELANRVGGTDYLSSYHYTPYISYPSKQETLDYCLIKRGEILDVEAVDRGFSDHCGMMYSIEF